MEEIWKDIEGYEGLYQVSNLGAVKSYPREWLCGGYNNAPLLKFTHTGKLLKQYLKPNGYYGVCLYKDKKPKQISVHRLVASAFISNKHNKPQVNHIDGNKQNNNITNLEWATCSENQQHAVRHGFIKSGENSTFSKFLSSEVIEIRKLINSKLFTQTQIANAYGVTQSTISDIKLNIKYKEWNE